MLVFLDANATDPEINAIRERASDSGFQSTHFREPGQNGVLLIEGVNADDAAEWAVVMSGVDRVATTPSDDAPVTNNLRIAGIRPLVPPAILQDQLPLPPESARRVHQ